MQDEEGYLFFVVFLSIKYYPFDKCYFIYRYLSKYMILFDK